MSDVDTIVSEIVAEFAADRTRLLDIVLGVQNRIGHVDRDAVQAIAGALRIHGVDVQDMVSFYALFAREPAGRFRIRLSKTPLSLIRDAQDVARAFEQALGIRIGET